MLQSIIQRAIGLLISIRTLPLWMGPVAALPRDWPPPRIYLGIVIVIALASWMVPARAIRSTLLSLRRENPIVAARLTSANDLRLNVMPAEDAARDRG